MLPPLICVGGGGKLPQGLLRFFDPAGKNLRYQGVGAQRGVVMF